MTINFSWAEVEQILREHIKIDTSAFDVHPAMVIAITQYGEETLEGQAVEFAITPKGPEVVDVPPVPGRLAMIFLSEHMEGTKA